ncbi:MAG TPA: hypothetical protein VJC05_04070 [Candidatus Andersenbacteria bacterium]|nr:hypothetical protein [Candidatus Andersenbacteria bacterium]
MNKALLGVVIAVIVLAVGGLLVYRSTAPNGDVVPVGETTLEEELEEGVAPGQFMQVAPTGGPLLSPVPTATSAVSATTTPTPAASGVTISMTETGFAPATVRIKAGSTVTFVNDGQALHWPASDVHPTHDVLPGFDSRGGVATGGSYAYTFTKVGSWRFHDHLNPQFAGTVVVE